VIPPNADLLIESFTFKVASPRTRRNKQVDFFLISLAEAMGARAIGIISLGMVATVLRDASTSRQKEEQPLLRTSLPK